MIKRLIPGVLIALQMACSGASQGSPNDIGTGNEPTECTSGTCSDVPDAPTECTSGTCSDVPDAPTECTSGTCGDVPDAPTECTSGTCSDVPDAPTECTSGTCSEVPEGYPIAANVDGMCAFTPGVYVAFYEVLDSDCGNLSALEQRMVVVAGDGNLTFNPAGATPAGCVDSDPVATECSVAFDRTCGGPTAFGFTEFVYTFDFHYASGSGYASLAHTNYVGDTVDYSCVSNMRMWIIDPS